MYIRIFRQIFAMSPALQERLVTDVVANVLQSALLSTEILSVDVKVCPNPKCYCHAYHYFGYSIF